MIENSLIFLLQVLFPKVNWLQGVIVNSNVVM